MITEMSIAEVMQRVASSCDTGRLSEPQDWVNMLVTKLSHSQVPSLIDSIERNGFTQPITLVPQRDGSYRVGNGHHRLAVQILRGADTILVEEWSRIFSPQNSYGRCDYNLPYDCDTAEWLASQVAIDTDGHYIDHERVSYSGPGPAPRGSYEPSNASCDCSLCNPASESSDSPESSEPGSDYCDPTAYANVPACDSGWYVSPLDNRTDEPSQPSVFVPIECPGQLTLFNAGPGMITQAFRYLNPPF